MSEERNDGMLCAGIEDRFPKKQEPAEDARLARATYERMLRYSIEGCKRLLWKTAFDLDKPELTATEVQEIVFRLGQMANDLDRYEAEASRLGLDK